MKNKMLARRIAIAMLSAGMAFSATPVGVFADTVSVQASDAAASTGKIDITIDDTLTGSLTEDQKNTIKDKIKNIDIASETYFKDYGKTTQKVQDNATDTLKSALETAFDSTKSGITISDVKITDEDNWSFKYGSADGSAVAVVTVKTNKTYELTDDVKNVLDYYFANVVQKTYAGKTVTNKKIASDLTSWAKGVLELNGAKVDDASKKTLENVTFEGDLSPIGSDGTIKITVKAPSYKTTTATGVVNENDTDKPSDDKGVSYSSKVDIDAVTDTQEAALAKAIAAVEAKTYPSFVSNDDVTNGISKVSLNVLQNKIYKDLVDNGAPEALAKNIATGATNKAATSKADGTWWNSYGDGSSIMKLTLKYSSDQKISDTKKSIEKSLVGAKKQTSTATVTIEDPKDLQSVDTAKTVKGNKYVYGINTVLSSKLQKAGSTSYANIDDVVAAVKDEVEAQLKTDGVDTNGVTVTTTAIDPTISANASVYSDSKNANKGDYAVLVTASIPNDFYGWDDTADYAKDETTTVSYIVEVKTVDTKDVNATAIDLKDQTVSLTNKYSDKKYGEKKYTIVTLDAALTPEDANSEIKYYKVVKETGDTTELLTSTRTLYDADGNKVTLADNQFAVSEAGVYKVEAIAYIDGKPSRDVRDTATITVTSDSFDDNLNDAAYYKGAVDWAKANNIASGVGNNIFGVNQTVTRAQFVTWLYRYAQKISVKDVTIAEPTQVFSDVPTTAYYAAAVEWAKETGVVSGKTATTFAPNDNITRAEIAVMLNRYYGGEKIGDGSEDQASKEFTDVPETAYYASAVTWAAENGIVFGKTTTTFAPKDTATRAEAITMIARSFKNSNKSFVR